MDSTLLGAALASLKAGVGLVNDVDATATTYDLTVLVTSLQRLEGVGDLHDGST